MKTRIALPVLIGAAAAALPAGASAEVLIGTYVQNFEVIAGSTGDFTLQPMIAYTPVVPYDPAAVLGLETFTFADFVGGTVKTLTGNFADFAAGATNGVNDPVYMAVRTLVYEQQVTSDAAVFAGSDRILGAPDLSGYTLTRVAVMGTSLQFSLPTVSGTFEYYFFGERIPAPGALPLLGLGFLATRRRR